MTIKNFTNLLTEDRRFTLSVQRKIKGEVKEVYNSDALFSHADDCGDCEIDFIKISKHKAIIIETGNKMAPKNAVTVSDFLNVLVRNKTVISVQGKVNDAITEFYNSKRDKSFEQCGDKPIRFITIEKHKIYILV